MLILCANESHYFTCTTDILKSKQGEVNQPGHEQENNVNPTLGICEESIDSVVTKDFHTWYKARKTYFFSSSKNVL